MTCLQSVVYCSKSTRSRASRARASTSSAQMTSRARTPLSGNRSAMSRYDRLWTTPIQPMPITPTPMDFVMCQIQSDVALLEHRGGGLVEQLATANLLKAIQQIIGLQALFVGAAQVVDGPAAVHHQQPVAQVCG